MMSNPKSGVVFSLITFISLSVDQKPKGHGYFEHKYDVRI